MTVVEMQSAKARREERLALLERAYQEIERSGLGPLVDHVMRVRRALRRHMPTKFRVPYGLAAPQDSAPGKSADSRVPEGEGAVFVTQPQCVARFTHLVVTEDTAQSFVLEDFKVGKNSQLLSELELTFFSMKYQENDVLSDISRIGGDVAMVSQIVSLNVRRVKDGRGPKNFTGILWAEFDLD